MCGLREVGEDDDALISGLERSLQRLQMIECDITHIPCTGAGSVARTHALSLARSLSPKISSILHQESFHLRGPRRKRESTALTQELKKTLLALCYTVKRRKRILKINNKKPDFCPSLSLLLSPPPPRPPGQRRQLGQRPGRRR